MKAIQSVLLIWGLTISTMAWAQPPDQGPGPKQSEKIKAMKVEFITSKLELTPTEAEKFWPVYNEFIDKIHALEKNRRKTMRMNEGEELSDAQVNTLINLNFDTDQSIIDLKREYDVKFKKILSIQKVGKLYAAEDQFRRELLRKMKGNGPPSK